MSDRLAFDDADLLANIRGAEAFRSKAYADPDSPLGKQLQLPLKKRAPGWATFSGAPWTCGYGHTGPDVGPTTTCTLPQGETWLLGDAADAISCLDADEPWWRTMTVNRQRVLAEMVYNFGIGKLRGFHRFLADAEAAKWSDAAAEMLDSVWAGQVHDRATRLSHAMTQG